MPARRPWPHPLLACLLALSLTAGTASAAEAGRRHLQDEDDPGSGTGVNGGPSPATGAPDHPPAPGDPPAGLPTEDTTAEDPTGTDSGTDTGTDGTGGPPVEERDAAGVLSRLRSLYRQIGAAEEAARVGQERLRVQERRVAGVSAELAETRDALTAARAAAGRLAREEYRGGTALPSAIGTLLAADGRDPLAALHRRDVLERAGSRVAKLVTGLEAREERADSLAEHSRTELDTEQTLASVQEERHREVRARVGEAEEVLASLSDVEFAGLREVEQLADAEARREVAAGADPAAGPVGGETAADETAGDGTPGDDGRGTVDLPPSEAGRRAVAHARDGMARQDAAGRG
ncbi:hypothetical protein HCJ92_23140, partial [Streptomyces sp. ventii]|nr:hypothetical protein [Streptomyces spiramenti]